MEFTNKLSGPSAPHMGGGGPGYPSSVPGYPPQVQGAFPQSPQPGPGGFAAPGQPQQFGASPYPPSSGGFGALPAVPAQSQMPQFGHGSGEPTAPGFISLPGFADSGFTPIVQPPTNPYFDDPANEPPKYERAIPPIAAINEEEILAAVSEYADKKCCYGKPEPLKVRNIEMKSAFKYSLTSFTEQRETVWKSEPYRSQVLEGHPMAGVGPWDIRVFPDSAFMDHKKELRIPNTSYIKPCHHCGGPGTIRCRHCLGMGFESCAFCHGSGRRISDERCTSCSGQGRRMCSWCYSKGFKECDDCSGRGQLFMYLQLIATWKNYTDEFIGDSPIPQKLMSKAVGTSALSEKQKMVAPFTDFPDPAVTNASRDLIRKHGRAYTAQMIILEQKQSVDIIRIAEVHYTWKEKSGIFHVYGDNNNVYFPDYPNTCACCVIL